jgi:hypothetical protein
MSWKLFFFIILILILGVFIYFKIQILGSPDSQFNQTTRLKLGRYPIVRTLLGLHSVGDAREEYFTASGPLYIVWFKSETLDLDTTVLNQFAALVAKYTGRTTQVVSGASLSTGTVPLTNLNAARIGSDVQVPGGGSKLFVYFVNDYSPRADQELSTTYLESGMAVSLSAQTGFLGGNNQNLDNYLLSDLLHEFGNQIGLKEQATDSSCIMDLHAGINGQPMENYGQATPQDFCPAEQAEITQLKSQY